MPWSLPHPCTLHNALTGHHHKSSQSHTKYSTLPKVEEGETSGVLQSSCFILCKNTVVFISLILLIIEILQE